MSNKTINLTDSLHQYLLNHSLREPEEMEDLRLKTAELPEHNMQIAPEQAQFMQLLIHLMGAKKAIEIGTFTGYSALAIALALPREGELICCDISERWMQIGKPFWEGAGIANKINFKLGAAVGTLDKLLATGHKGQFDFAFIDADKENYQAYYERCLELLRPKGLLLIDNTLWDGAVCDPKNNETSTKAIRAFNESIHHDERIELSLLPVADGLTLALVK